jgi:TPR repeat protein
MRFCPAVLIGLSLALLPASAWSESNYLNEIAPADETPEHLCDRLAADPFVGFGPDEWGHPFSSIDFYRAVPACKTAMERHPEDKHFVLQAALAYVAGKKTDEAKALLMPLIAEGNTTAMLALAYISPENEAADLLRKASDAGNASATLLFGMAQLYGNGLPKNQIDGVRTIRRAAEAGSTRAMLIMANFYRNGDYGVGRNTEQAKALVAQAAGLGDPAAQNVLAGLDEEAPGAKN